MVVDDPLNKETESFREILSLFLPPTTGGLDPWTALLAQTENRIRLLREVLQIVHEPRVRLVLLYELNTVLRQQEVLSRSRDSSSEFPGKKGVVGIADE